MFSEAYISVILSTKGGVGLCILSLLVWLPGPMFLCGGLCPWTHVPCRGISVQTGSLSGLYSGDLCPEWNSEKQAVYILLECFLVLHYFHKIGF